jgi:hypothetical protein
MKKALIIALLGSFSLTSFSQQTNKKGSNRFLLNEKLELKPLDLLVLFESHAVAKKKLSELQTEVNRLRATPSLESFLLGTNRNPLVGLNSLHTKTLIIGDDKALGKMESGGTVGLLGSSINDNLLIGNPSNKKCF